VRLAKGGWTELQAGRLSFANPLCPNGKEGFFMAEIITYMIRQKKNICFVQRLALFFRPPAERWVNLS
jgi:ribosomal protein S27AE